jgi:hypothetical protein
MGGRPPQLSTVTDEMISGWAARSVEFLAVQFDAASVLASESGGGGGCGLGRGACSSGSAATTLGIDQSSPLRHKKPIMLTLTTTPILTWHVFCHYYSVFSTRNWRCYIFVIILFVDHGASATSADHGVIFSYWASGIRARLLPWLDVSFRFQGMAISYIRMI